MHYGGYSFSLIGGVVGASSATSLGHGHGQEVLVTKVKMKIREKSGPTNKLDGRGQASTKNDLQKNGTRHTDMS